MATCEIPKQVVFELHRKVREYINLFIGNNVTIDVQLKAIGDMPSEIISLIPINPNLAR
jgi:hypothetical protein